MSASFLLGWTFRARRLLGLLRLPLLLHMPTAEIQTLRRACLHLQSILSRSDRRPRGGLSTQEGLWVNLLD